MTSFTLITNRKGGSNLIYMGYLFTTRKIASNCITWRCTNRQCPATVETCGEEIVQLKLHNHDKMENKISSEVIKSLIKQRGISTREKPIDIVNKYLVGANQEVAMHMPKIETMVDEITRDRRNKNLSVCGAFVERPERQRLTLKSEVFLFLDEVNVITGKIMVYTTYNNLMHLGNTNIWICDGTFYVCPKEFMQLYTIEGFVRDKFYPLVYILMEKNTQQAYEYIFEFLKRKIVGQPLYIVLDFEVAAMNALSVCFISSRINGCFFHFSQILWRRIQADGFSLRYKTDSKFRTNFSLVVALAFVPDVHVKAMFAKLVDYFLNTNVDEYLINFLFYFERIYISNNTYRKINTKGECYYSWVIYESIIHGIARTSNSLEGLHRTFNERVSRKNPSLDELLDLLKDVQNVTEFKIMKSLYNDNISSDTKCNFLSICKEFDKFYGIEYLMKVQFFFKIKV